MKRKEGEGTGWEEKGKGEDREIRVAEGRVERQMVLSLPSPPSHSEREGGEGRERTICLVLD